MATRSNRVSCSHYVFFGKCVRDRRVGRAGDDARDGRAVVGALQVVVVEEEIWGGFMRASGCGKGTNVTGRTPFGFHPLVIEQKNILYVTNESTMPRLKSHTTANSVRRHRLIPLRFSKQRDRKRSVSSRRRASKFRVARRRLRRSMRQREKGGDEHQIIFNATWCTREQVEGTGLYTFVQIDSALLRNSGIHTGDSRITRYLEWLYNLIGPELVKLGIKPTNLNLANDFYSQGTAEQNLLGWHFTVNKKMSTENGQELFDKESSQAVKVVFTPKDIVCLPTIYRPEDTLAKKLKDDKFQKLHISDDNTWVQLAQIGLGGDIKVFSTTSKDNLLAEKIYIPGKVGNPHITLCSLRAQKKVLDEILKFEKQQPLENNLRKSDNKPLFENIQRVGNTFLPELNAHMQAKATIKHPQLYVLIGPPAVGKSTWIKNTPHLHSYTVISHDDIVDRCIAEYNDGLPRDDLRLVYSDYRKVPDNDLPLDTVDLKYGEVIEVGEKKKKMYAKINELKEQVNKEFDSTWKTALKQNNNVIVDMVNMTKFARGQWIDRFSHYYKTAVDFKFDINQILTNARRRSEQTGKSIPESEIRRIAQSYEPLTENEGFDNIVNQTPFPNKIAVN